MPQGIDESWDRIVGWLRTHAPVTAKHLGPPATDDDIVVVEALLGGPLPTDLLAWWRRSCGAEGPHRLLLLPTYVPYSIDEAVEFRELMLDVAPDVWLRQWLPIAGDGCGWRLFVDQEGRVRLWDKYEAAAPEPLWPGVAAMLADIADALENGTDLQYCHPEARDDGTLDWVK